jgi:hypothetical protein
VVGWLQETKKNGRWATKELAQEVVWVLKTYTFFKKEPFPKYLNPN